MRSLVSPLFLKELKKPALKNQSAPLPDGYRYQKRGTSLVYVYYHSTMLGKCDSIEEARESIILHSQGHLVFDTVRAPASNFVVRKVDAYRWQVWDGERLMTVQTAKVRAMKWIEENTK